MWINLCGERMRKNTRWGEKSAETLSDWLDAVDLNEVGCGVEDAFDANTLAFIGHGFILGIELVGETVSCLKNVALFNFRDDPGDGAGSLPARIGLRSVRLGLRWWRDGLRFLQLRPGDQLWS